MIYSVVLSGGFMHCGLFEQCHVLMFSTIFMFLLASLLFFILCLNIFTCLMPHEGNVGHKSL